MRNDSNRRSRTARYFGVGLARFFALCVLLLAPLSAWAQTSGYCPNISATVAHGGSVTLVRPDCNAGFGFGPIITPATHGSAQAVFPASIVYSHNGSSGTTDSFVVHDGESPPNNRILVSITITPPASALVVGPGSLSGLVAGAAFNQQLTTTGGVMPYTYSISSGTIIPGLSLSPQGVISGAPTRRGTYNFDVRSQDAVGDFALKSYTGTVANPSLSLVPATATAYQGTPFSRALSTVGGVAPHTYAIEGAAQLPSGLSLSSAGVISGTPTGPLGPYAIQLRVTDASTGIATYFEVEPFTLTLSPAPTIVVNPATLPNATVAAAYMQSLSGSGGTVPYAFSVTTGVLPPGLSLTAAGVLSGTPTAGGSFTFGVRATDGNSAGPFSGTRQYTLVVAPATVTLPATTLADATLSNAYSATLNPASGGTAPYVYSVTAGTFPPGLMLSASGTITGTPTAIGTFNFAVTATDSSGGSGPYSSAPRGYSLQVVNLPPVANPVSASVGFNAGATPVALNIGGGAPTSVAVVTAPTHGMAIASGTSITYQPTPGYAGPDSFTYSATNNAGTSVPPGLVSMTVGNPTITVTASGPLTAQIGAAYTNTFSWTGGTQPFSGYQVTGLPAGLAVTGNTVNSVTVSGTPTQSGSATLNVSATDSSTGNGPFTAGQAFTLTVSAPILTLTPAAGTLSATYGVAYSQTWQAGGGTAPYDYTVSAGALPAGLTLSSTSGVLSGTPIVTGLYTFSVRARDASTGAGAPFARTQNYVMQVASPIIQVLPAVLPAGTAGVAYATTQFTATGGIGPYTFALTAGALPPGLTLAPDGTLSGMPTASGTFNLMVTTTDAHGQSRAIPYVLQVAVPTLDVTPTSLPDGVAGTAYTETLSTTGGIAPYTYTLSGGTLPAGITFVGGVFAGTPTEAGTFTPTVLVTDSTGGTAGTATLPYTLVIDAPTIVVDPASLPDGLGGTAYDATFTATGGAGTHTFAVTAGALPTGLALDPSGVLGGVPTAAGTFNFTVTASDENGFPGSRAYAITIDAPTIVVAPATLPDGLGGTAYTQTISASGGNGAYTYAVTAGTLPAGITLAPEGVLAGTPTVAGTFTPTVTATDVHGFTGSAAYTLVIDAPTIVVAPPTVPSGIAGEPYTVAFSASGGTPAYTYAVTAGTLPAGVTLATDGALSGTPTVAGAFGFTVTASDVHGFTGSRAYSLQLDMPNIVLTPSVLPAGVAGEPYTIGLVASGGTADYTFALTSGALPAGITLATDGVLGGTPTVAGTFNVVITATDALGFIGTHAYTLVFVAPAIVVAPPALPAGIAGEPYSVTFTASGGTSAYTFMLTTGVLPAGLTLATDGTLSGTPTEHGNYAIGVTAFDALGFEGSQGYTLSLAAPTIVVAPATLPSGIAGEPYAAKFTASGGTSAYTFAVTAGTLPAGLALGPDGNLSGTPTVDGDFDITVTATDALGFPGIRTYTLSLAAPTITVAPATLPPGVGGEAYTASFSASGGTAAYTFAVTAGTLPSGLGLLGDGALAGTPTEDGDFAITVTATDALGFTGSQAYILSLTAPPITLAPATLPPGTAGSAYDATVTAAGGTAPYTFAVTGGALPAGVTLGTDGVIAGAPTEAGTFDAVITATDALGFTGAQAYAIAINGPIIVVAPATVPTGVAGEAYTATLTASGGLAPYALAITAGTLPSGLALASDGTLAGTPTQSGTFDITATATDANGFTGSLAYVLTIDAPLITVTPPTLPQAIVGGAYAQSLGATGGIAPHTFAVTAGALPAGLALASDGTLAGTPTAQGTASFTVTASDANAQTGMQAYTLVVLPELVLPATMLPDADANTPYAATLNQATGGVAPYAYVVTAGALPAGVTLGANGALSGEPTEAGSFTFTVTATDSEGHSATRDYTLVVAAEAQVITFPPQTVTERPFVAGGSFVLGPIASGGDSGNPVVYTAAPADVCTIDGITVTMVGPGTCRITATQAGGGGFDDATPVTQQIVLQGVEPPIPGVPTIVPTLSTWMLMLLALTLAGFGAWVRREH